MNATRNVRDMRPPRRVLPWLWVTLAVVLGFFLLTEHQAHLFGALPYLLVLLCPLMHLFMHHGHGGHEHGGHGRTAPQGPPDGPERKVRP